MGVPGFTAEAALATTGTGGATTAVERYGPLPDTFAIEPQACSWGTKLACAARISTCASVCTAAGSLAWVSCMANCLSLMGSKRCLECLR